MSKYVLLGWLVACAPASQEPARPVASAPTASPLEKARVPEHCRDKPAVTLVETVPVESELDDSPRARTHEVWRAMIDAAEKSLEIEQFYVSNGGRLEPIIAAIERAATRGVTVRFIADASFAKTYPDTLARLGRRVTLRKLDASQNLGGVQHAKYFVVDGCELYFGSANFDWRSLEHIHELGLRVRSLEIGSALREVFEIDWALAAGEPRPKPTETFGRFPLKLEGALVYHIAFSPRGGLPDERSWDLPQLVAAIDGAKQKVRVELLSYEPVTGEDQRFEDLDAALRRAAGRGVAVQLLVSHWNTRAGKIEHLKSLALTKGIEVRIATIVEHSKGFIPFARVIHAKYMVVDDRVLWIGTSNWSGDYFMKSRNVGAVVDGAPLAVEVAGIFDDLWGSAYSEPLDPDREYPPPRISQ